jgi:AmmeMemoRadiSam system protein A
MGKFEPNTPLWKTVIDRTIAAAEKDPRFNPVEPNEIEDVTIEISVLSKPEPIDDWQKIELGTHGVIVQKGSQGGTYLPQVGIEEDWENAEEFLAHLCANKAGLPIDCYKDPNVELLTYTADVFSE